MPMTCSSDSENRSLADPASATHWATLKQRFKMPNPLVLHVAEVMYDQHLQRVGKFQKLNPEMQQHYYRIVEATMRAMGKL